MRLNRRLAALDSSEHRTVPVSGTVSSKMAFRIGGTLIALMEAGLIKRLMSIEDIVKLVEV